jgi:hypothetical protein
MKFLPGPALPWKGIAVELCSSVSAGGKSVIYTGTVSPIFPFLFGSGAD